MLKSEKRNAPTQILNPGPRNSIQRHGTLVAYIVELAFVFALEVHRRYVQDVW